MKNSELIHPSVRENHANTVAWNEYVILHIGLQLKKENRSDYRSMSVFQGTFCLYHNWTVNIKPITNVEMHRYLKTYLESYLRHFETLPGVSANPEFKPPVF